MSRSDKTILIVVDDAGTRDVVSRLFSEAGYETAVAPDGPAGLAAARDGEFGLVILDTSLRDDIPATAPLRYAEMIHIKRVLELKDWNQSAAARVLGIDRKTLRNKIREFKLEK